MNAKLHRYFRGRLAASASTLAIGCFFVHGAQAQEVSQEASQRSEGRGSVEVVIVTADKRAEDVQDVPTAITALTAEALEVRGIETPEDLQLSTPGLVISQQLGGAAQTSIRGITTENVYPGGDPGVPIHINGHYTQSTAYVFRDFLDIERIEVQRGPQGTLYGRNAIGGNVNIITKRPTDYFEGMFSTTAGNYDRRLLQGVLSGPISDSVRARIAVSDETRDGYVKDIGFDTYRSASDYTSLRGAVEVDLASNLTALINAYYYTDEGDDVFISNFPTNDISDPFTINTNSAVVAIDESNGVSLDFVWDIAGIQIKSLSAYDTTDKAVNWDLDGTSIFSTEQAYHSTYETWTQEFQFLSASDGPLQWVAGLFYYDEFSGQRYRPIVDDYLGYPALFGLADGDRVLMATAYDIASNSIAVFGQANYSLTDQLTLVLGLRNTWDKKERDYLGRKFYAESDGFMQEISGAIPPLPRMRSDANWEQLTWRFGVNFDIDDDRMLYGSYTRGYKAGGFNFDTTGIAYDPEKVDALEGGLKSIWADGQLLVNLAAFYYDYEDKQDFQRLPPPEGYRIRNAAKASIWGLEAEVQAYLTDDFKVDLSASFQNAEFDEYSSIDVLRPALGTQDLSGNKLPRAPEWKLSGGAQYEWRLGAHGDLLLRGDVLWVDEQWANGLNRRPEDVQVGQADLIPAYSQVNARIQWTSADGEWQLEAYATNLTNEVILQNSLAYTADWMIEVYAPPRMYGAKLTHRF